MKKYVSGFLFFLCLTSGCLLTLFFMTSSCEEDTAKKVQATESVEQPAFAKEDKNEAETMVHLVLNQEKVTAAEAKEKYCLVAENGYLIVYDDEDETVDLFTHMPLMEFPEKEQERLMEGIWFSTMAEIFSYLESYSS